MVEQQRKYRIHLTNNLLGQLRKSNKPLNPKTISLRQMLFLVLQKDRRGFNRIQLRLTRYKFEQWPSCSFRWRFNGRRRTRQWLCVLYWSFLCRPQWRRVDTTCKLLQMGAQNVCRYEGRFCLRALSWINTVLFLVCILCISNFFKLCNYSLWFLCKLFISPN